VHLHDLTTKGGDVYRQVKSMLGTVGGDEAFLAFLSSPFSFGSTSPPTMTQTAENRITLVFLVNSWLEQRMYFTKQDYEENLV
jgi:hypothetical protein